MRIKIKLIGFLLISWFLLHEIIIVVDGLNDNPVKSDYAVIFGNTVNPDGTLSDRLKARVNKGLQLYNDSLVDKIVVSGGLGKEGVYEGAKMSEYLISHGVPGYNVITDDNGNNTLLTVQNFSANFPESSSVIVVSQFYHISRAKLAFRKAGVKKVTGAHPNYYELRDIYSLFREFFGYYKYLLF
ncbi:MAG: YdcF family protein [Cyclobacteriaceae bacterium]|nr:YdcF family protein [Cyclobacteriaceae bacterium]